MSEQEKRDKLVKILREWALQTNDGISFESIADFLLAKGIEVPS